MTEKLQKIIARTGIGSRRELESWIEAGRVSVNGETASLGDRATDSDVIRVDGKKIDAVFDTGSIRVLRYHKPLGVVCTRRDPEGRTTVFERLPSTRTGRWIAVGRLDINTSGLLLFTDSGDLANQLMHPSSQAVREYAVRIYGSLTPEILKSLSEGVELDDGPARFDSITDAGGEGRNHWYHVRLCEGRNRIVRRIWESQGIEVSRLIRIGYAGVELPRRLRAGRWEFLAGDDLKALHTTAGLYTGKKAGVADNKAGEADNRATGSDKEPQFSSRRKPAHKKATSKKSKWPGKTPTKHGR